MYIWDRLWYDDIVTNMAKELRDTAGVWPSWLLSAVRVCWVILVAACVYTTVITLVIGGWWLLLLLSPAIGVTTLWYTAYVVWKPSKV